MVKSLWTIALSFVTLCSLHFGSSSDFFLSARNELLSKTLVNFQFSFHSLYRKRIVMDEKIDIQILVILFVVTSREAGKVLFFFDFFFFIIICYVFWETNKKTLTSQ